MERRRKEEVARSEGRERERATYILSIEKKKKIGKNHSSAAAARVQKDNSRDRMLACPKAAFGAMLMLANAYSTLANCGTPKGVGMI